jgi:hypothetical protein
VLQSQRARLSPLFPFFSSSELTSDFCLLTSDLFSGAL